MKQLALLTMLMACSSLKAQDIDLGRSEPPYVEATVTMPAKFMSNAEKRCDMVRELSEKCEMNYRLLGGRMMQHWQAQIKKDKTFVKDLLRYKTVAFTVKEDGTIEIKGVEEEEKPAKPAKTKGRAVKGRSNQ
jgi:hypothetical protein